MKGPLHDRTYRTPPSQSQALRDPLSIRFRRGRDQRLLRVSAAETLGHKLGFALFSTIDHPAALPSRNMACRPLDRLADCRSRGAHQKQLKYPLPSQPHGQLLLHI